MTRGRVDVVVGILTGVLTGVLTNQWGCCADRRSVLCFLAWLTIEIRGGRDEYEYKKF